jgi:hypothetical protein
MSDQEGPVTVVLGASERVDRYANMAVRRLRTNGHAVVAVGPRPGAIGDVPIMQQLPQGPVDTVTLYVGPVILEQWRSALLELHPRRIVFNPGTEHPAFEAEASAHGIAVEVGCTLVMLAAGTY